MIRYAVFLALFIGFWGFRPEIARAENLPQAELSYADFARIPVLHEGRVKPLDSFARIWLKEFSGRETFEKQSAIEWLAATLFEPASGAERRIFLIRDPEIRELLELPPGEARFSLAMLQKGLAKTAPQALRLAQQDENSLTPPQRELLRLHADALRYIDLLDNLSLLLPARDQEEAQPAAKTASLEAWRDIAEAYRNRDNAAFAAAARRAQELNGEKGISPARISAEIWANAIKPFYWALGFYAAAFLLGAGVAVWGSARFFKPALYCFAAAVFVHFCGIAARVFILARPPVGTLYESALFVSLICALPVLALAARKKSAPVLVAGSLCAGAILAAAPALLQQGESMEMLVAVLNTNFWLATHVLCITAGYGICILTALLAHLWMIAQIRGPESSAPEMLRRPVDISMMAALLLTAIGTILGGIWADQSWGRFWGWDPKENGALLIVLWLVWLQHGKISGRLSPLPYMAGLAFLNVIVALAWFGVNLLSVGLHSYGFTSGIAAALGLFCATQTSLIAALWTAAKRRQKNAFRMA